MKQLGKEDWSDALRAFFDGGRQLQVAALCYRDTAEGRKVLLITSRDSGRWIIPKGWPVPGKDGPASALQEAWEEAGVRAAEIAEVPLGHYGYDKGLANGDSIPIHTSVYLARVSALASDYPEAEERQRAWFTPEDAATRVEEPELQAILRDMAA